MKIVIGSDHHGYEIKKAMKEYLKSLNYDIEDMGTNSGESVDYPKYAKIVCEEVLKEEDNLGILLCGTGIGMSIAANKINGIKCAKVDNTEEARLSKCHNNANVIALSSNKKIEELKEIAKTFITSRFSNEERHVRRNKEIDNF